jgi:peptide deformylase
VGLDINGDELSIEADTLEARCFQHEVDHLDGILVLDRLDPESRREARRMIRARALAGPAGDEGATAGPR